MLKRIDDNSILIVPSKGKNKIIKDIRDEYYDLNIKFMTLVEFKKLFYFDYDKKTIYYLMNKYNYKEEVVRVYLDNLYYIKDKEYKSKKINFLKELKSELDSNNLLMYDNLFLNSLKNKKIYIYGFTLLDKFYSEMFNEVRKITNVEIINIDKKEYNHDCVYSFSDIDLEVNFVAVKIRELIDKGIDINKIKIANIDNEYNNTLIRIFSFYNIPLYLNRKISLYSTTIGKYFLDNINSDIEVTLKLVRDKFKDSLDIYNKIINILNDYSWCLDYNNIKNMLIYDFKNTYISEDKYEKVIECIDIIDNIINDDEYIFLMNFSQGCIPKICKDEDYITDNIKSEVNNIDSVIDNNINNRKKSISTIKSIKNLTISFKENSLNGSYVISNLVEELNLNIINNFVDSYSYSNIYNKLRLSSYIDEFIKYGIVNNDLGKLYNNYKNITYLDYNNRFKGIDKDNLYKYLDNKLLLSYSTIDNYYRCGFRYYISNILKLSIFEDTFMTTLGSLFHYILSNSINDDNYDVDYEYDKYIKECGKDFSYKELFFLDKLRGELKFIIKSIRKQMNCCELNKTLFEEEIYIDKSNKIKVTFMGIVDKIIYDDIDDKCIVSIIDYKTGNPNININNTIYGIEMQLPVYLYLVKNSGKFSNVSIAGFYLQKILNNEITRDNKNTYEALKENNLKLQGYSNSNVDILKYFDNSYDDSKVIKSLKTSSKGFYSYSKVICEDDIDRLVNIVDNKIDKAIDEILNGNFEINPKRIGKTNYGCEFCKFKDICFMNENNIINLDEYKNLEFLKNGGNSDDTK